MSNRFNVTKSFDIAEAPLLMKTRTSETSSSLSNLNLGDGKGLVKMSAMFAAVGTYLIFYNPCFSTSPQNFKCMSICLVLDFDDSFPIENIAGLLSPKITVVS